MFYTLITYRKCNNHSQFPASDKPDLGLEELQKLNVKERFQVFENFQAETYESDRGPVNPTPRKSPSILSKLAK